mmetsp:Transcript_9590/g.27669  ORF Transcript_9590/g.27669 Transcript_9590/m.27669 type:complete len:256 (-) Transcript_9590:424-1191(-)
MILGAHGCEAPVDDLDGRRRAVRRIQQILRFQIPVDDAILMAVPDGRQDLLHHHGGMVLAEVAALDDSCEQLSTRAQLQHQIDVLIILKHLKQFYDVGVVEFLHDSDLPFEPGDVLDPGLLDDLHCTDSACPPVPRLLHASIAALAQLLAGQLVVVLNRLILSKALFLHDALSVEGNSALAGTGRVQAVHAFLPRPDSTARGPGKDAEGAGAGLCTGWARGSGSSSSCGAARLSRFIRRGRRQQFVALCRAARAE